MSCANTLNPLSTVSSVTLPSTGSAADVAACVPFGIYSSPSSDFYSADFLSGAADQVAYTYKMLGGDVLDIELKACNIYSCYEESLLEYSSLMNIHQAQNVLQNALGGSTGSFDQDGNLKDGILKTSLSGSHINLKYPRFTFAYSRKIGEAIGNEVGVGGNVPQYSASFDLVAGKQDYDLQQIISSSAALTSSLEYYQKVGNKRIIVQKVFYKTPAAHWRFFGYYGGLNTVGNLSTYGQYADDSTFEIIPAWHNKLQAQTYRENLNVRFSHYSYEIKNNKIRIFPAPPNPSVAYPSKMWIQFRIDGDAWDLDTDKDIGVDGINNINSLPFGNIPYNSINAIGKHWIRRYALACAKGVLSLVRGKYETIPIPGNSVTLNSARLAEESDREKKELREEFKVILDKLTYKELLNSDAEIMEANQKIQEKIPMLIYVG